MTTTRPPVARRCEDCGLVLSTAYRHCCPKCGGWMLTVSSNEAPDMEDAAEMIPLQLISGREA